MPDKVPPRVGFRERWQAVNAVTQREARDLSPADRERQFLFALALGRQPEMLAARDDGAEVRRRWCLLHRKLMPWLPLE